ncbi:DUF2158 domain-containing protein [Pontibacter litorisediminis]|uniref:DUF2158 domain-containing protein n=1 Tax=Pontibacter litorisediminis TaxID=1846260 RepID=UPI0023ED4148|nr:DUF2158 domain-containing protein [Pontibacter litorisediminis]
MQHTLNIGDSVCLKSSAGCRMTVARVANAQNTDLLRPLQAECLWFDGRGQSHLSRFPVAMLTSTQPNTLANAPDKD